MFDSSGGLNKRTCDYRINNLSYEVINFYRGDYLFLKQKRSIYVQIIWHSNMCQHKWKFTDDHNISALWEKSEDLQNIFFTLSPPSPLLSSLLFSSLLKYFECDTIFPLLEFHKDLNSLVPFPLHLSNPHILRIQSPLHYSPCSILSFHSCW